MKTEKHEFAVLQIRIEPADKEALIKAAVAQGVFSVATMARMIIRQWLERQAEEKAAKARREATG